MSKGWYDVLVVVLLVGAFVIPRAFARPEQHPWQVWLRAIVAIGAIVYGAATADGGLAALFAVVLLVEVWRTWPVWKRIRGARGQ